LRHGDDRRGHEKREENRFTMNLPCKTCIRQQTEHNYNKNSTGATRDAKEKRNEKKQEGKVLV